MSFILQVVNLSNPQTYTGVLPYTNGGTGLSTVGTTGNSLISTGSAWSSATVTINVSSVTGVLPPANGGTGLSSVGTTGNALVSTGSAWNSAAVSTNLASVTGILAVGNGGTGQTSLTPNSLIVGNGAAAVNFFSPGTSGTVATSTGTTWSSATTLLPWTTKTTTYTAVKGDYLQADTSSAAFTITLPATPAVNDTVYFQDAKGTWANNNLTVAPGSNNIMGQAGNLTVNQSGTGFGMIYNGTEWRIF